MAPPAPGGIATVIASMQERLDALPPELTARRDFLATYQRTTAAVGEAIEQAPFEDRRWVERWDVVFADLYLDALDADLAGEPGRVPRPWRLAFDAPADLPALRHVLLGINAHINYDLPQALLAVISDEEFADPACSTRRAATTSGSTACSPDGWPPRTTSCAALSAAPCSTGSSRRSTGRASHAVPARGAAEGVAQHRWRCRRARLSGPEAYAVRLAELEVLSAARIADLLAPGQVLLRLAVAGFGVLLPPPA